MRRHSFAGWIAGTLLVACSGCDAHPDAPPTSTSLEEATVTGTVRIRGKPVNNGTVTFNPGNIRRQQAVRKASINKDGTYSLKTLVGSNSVQVACKEMQLFKNRLTQYLDQDFPFTVNSGENTYDIDIPPGAQPQPPPK